MLIYRLPIYCKPLELLLTLFLHGHCPVMRSHCRSVEPVGSQSQGLQPLDEKPKW